MTQHSPMIFASPLLRALVEVLVLSAFAALFAWLGLKAWDFEYERLVQRDKEFLQGLEEQGDWCAESFEYMEYMEDEEEMEDCL
ncbi:MAG: hypothetical protein ACI4SG_00640 [Oligosphaeraceae bacterium]